MDLSFGMLAWDAAARPPGAVADIARCRWPPSPSTTPSPRSCSTTSPTLTPGSPSWPASHAPAAACWPPFPAPPAATPARDRIDTGAQDVGWQIAAWYTQLKTAAVQILGSAAAMATAARPAGGPSGRTAADRLASRRR
jgi:hypothetical protein